MSKGWPVRRLGDLAELITKGTTPTSVGHEFVKEGVKFVKVESISSTGHFIKDKVAYITLECHAELRRSQLASGDILFSIAGALGRTALVTDDILPANTNQAISIIRLKKDAGLLAPFVLRALEASVVLDQIERLKGGVAQQNLSLAQVRDFIIPLPALPEQRRIVNLLDEAFGRIATAKASTERSLKQSRSVFQCKLDAIFDDNAWPMQPLSDVCAVFADGDWIESKDQSSDGIRLIQTGNVGAGVFKGRESKARFISEATFNRLRCTEIFPGDCLVSRLPDPVGRSCLLPESGSRMITAVDCTIIRFNERQVLPEFFVNYSLSSAYLRAIRAATTGTTRDRISRSNLGRVPMPTPSIPEQRRAVKELAGLDSDVRHLESIYTRKIAALDELKQSLLHKAFSGQL